MNNYRIRKTSWEEMRGLLEKFIQGLKAPTDSFWEEKLLHAQVYAIEVKDCPIGFFSVYKEELLSSFYLLPEAFGLEQELFHAAMHREFVQAALVPTCDESFLGLSLDHAKRIERQAYFFRTISPSSFKNDLVFKFAERDDIPLVESTSGDFFESAQTQIEKKEILLVRLNDELIGFGVYERGQFRKEYVSIGMYVVPQKRLQGYGTKILRGLQSIALKEDKIPIAGCWVWNHGSKKTLEQSGMAAVTRYMKISF